MRIKKLHPAAPSIRRARRLAEMSQLALALAIGRSPSFIAYFENGRNSPSKDEIAAMRAAIQAHEERA